MALLAVAGDQGAPRERLLSLIWPESAPERARNSLKQLLSTLRRALPPSALAGTSVLRLDRAAVACDLWDFEAALARGELEIASSLYAGPFLDGFSLPGAVEFERWAESERVRIAGEFRQALETLAERATAAGDHRTAVGHLRRLAAAEPLDSDVALRLMFALVASGNRAGALQHYDIHTALVHQELELAPDPAVAEYAAALRAPRVAAAGGATASPRAPTSVPAPPNAHAQSMLRLVVDDEPTADPAVADTPPPPLPPPPAITVAPSHDRGRRRRSVALGGMLVLAVAFAAAGVARWRAARRARPDATTTVAAEATVAVLPFAVRGGPAVAELGSGVAELLSASLDGAGRLRAVDPRRLADVASTPLARTLDERAAEALARRVNARWYVTGSVVEISGRVRLVAQLHDRESGVAAQEAVETTADSVFAAVDDLAALLLAERLRAPADRLGRAAATGTRSLPALKAFLVGETELRDGRFADAAASYARAVEHDSAFALAWYRTSQSAEWLGRDDEVVPAAQRALRLGSRLSSQDSLLVRAFVERREGRLDDAERLYRSIVAEWPDDVEGWFQLAELLFHGNPLRGRSATEARGAFERVMSLDPGDVESLVHLARIASAEGRERDVDSLVQRVLALARTHDVLEMRAFRAFALGDRQGQKRVTNELLAAPGSVPPLSALEVAVAADDIEPVERFARLLTGEGHSVVVQGYGHRLLAQLAAARGRWRAAQQQLDLAARFDSTAAIELRSLLAVLPFLPVSRADLEDVRAALVRWNPTPDDPPERVDSRAHRGLHPALRLYRLGLVSVRLGDTVAALDYARRLERESAGARDGIRAIAPATFATSIRARVADAAGRPDVALALVERARWQPLASGFMAEALDRWYRADLLRRLGRTRESRGWYRSIAERASYELVYLAPSRLRLAELAEADGATARAVADYRTFLDAWRDADPELSPLVERARRELARLTG